MLLKLENLQPSGSFKSRYFEKGIALELIIRGIGNYIRKAIERLGPNASPHCYCSSEGNAGTSSPR